MTDIGRKLGARHAGTSFKIALASMVTAVHTLNANNAGRNDITHYIHTFHPFTVLTRQTKLRSNAISHTFRGFWTNTNGTQITMGLW